MERILKRKHDRHRGDLYKIRWKGYGAKSDTWEPRANINESLVRAFNAEDEEDEEDAHRSPAGHPLPSCAHASPQYAPPPPPPPPQQQQQQQSQNNLEAQSRSGAPLKPKKQPSGVGVVVVGGGIDHRGGGPAEP